MKIFSKYDAADIAADHDVVMVHVSWDGEFKGVSAEDAEALEAASWFISEEYEGWACFV